MENIFSEQLKNDYLECKKIIDFNSKTFSYAFSFLSSPKKEAVWSLYAFNRTLDDISDEKKDKNSLDKEKKRFNDFLDGIVFQNHIYRTLNDVFMRFEMYTEPFYAMFRGQYLDIDFKNIETEEELLEYCYLVAGSVGHMLLPVIATKNKYKLFESAKYIGIAMQLTNILRDVGEDFSNGRIYLPKEMLLKYNVSIEKAAKDGVTENYINLWEHYAEMAKEYYEKGLEKIDLYDKDSKSIVLSAATLYAKLLDNVRNKNYKLN